MDAIQAKSWRFCFAIVMVALALMWTQRGVFAEKPGVDAAGNNLSYPVIWSEGIQKVLPGTPGMTPVLNGEWWYWWGTDVNGDPLASAPDPDNLDYLDDGVAHQYDPTLVPPAGSYKAYLQKDPDNTWQAGTADWYNQTPRQEVHVDWIDWGDNLESVDWYLKSKVRTEVVLFKELTAPMTQYGMAHTSGWGTDEVHGMAVNATGPVTVDNPFSPGDPDGLMPTVYSHLGRLTIQKLNVDELIPNDQNLAFFDWQPRLGWSDITAEDLISEPIYNMAVHEGGDGPGYYSAEINVKGKVIYGYTWDVKRLNEGAGYYRITFSLDNGLNDPNYDPSLPDLNTFFDFADIVVPVEEPTVLEGDDGGDTGGGTPYIDVVNNLTYIDVMIGERTGGGPGNGGNGGGPPGGPPGGPGNGNGGPSVPEPAAMLLLLLGTAFLQQVRRERPLG